MTVPPTPATRIASCSAGYAPVSSITRSAPRPLVCSRTVSAGSPCSADIGVAPNFSASSSRRGTKSTPMTSTPWPTRSWVVSRPITPRPKTTTISPTQALEAKTAFNATAPHPPDQITSLKIGDPQAGLLDFPDLGIAPVSHRILKGRVPWEEELSLRIPLLLQVRIGAPVVGQFGAG